MLDLHRLAKVLGVMIVFDPVITPRDDGDKDPLGLMATDDFLKRYWSDPEFAEARMEPVPVPRKEQPGEAVCGTGRSSFAIDPYGNIYPCVQWRRRVANIKEIASLQEVWHTSPVLLDVRRTAVEMADKLRTMQQAGQSGGFCNFCLGVADLQTGDPMNYYPQAAKNAEMRQQAYDAWSSKTGEMIEDDGGILGKCAM